MTPRLREKTVSSPAPSVQNGFSLISNEKLLQLYATMLKCRMIEDRSRIIIQQNKLKGNHASFGQEAAMVGLAMDLLPGDHIATNPGNVVPFFINGLPLETLFNGLLNSSAQASRNADPFKSATEAAKANKQANNKVIAVALCGISGSPSLSMISRTRQRSSCQMMCITSSSALVSVDNVIFRFIT